MFDLLPLYLIGLWASLIVHSDPEWLGGSVQRPRKQESLQQVTCRGTYRRARDALIRAMPPTGKSEVPTWGRTVGGRLTNICVMNTSVAT